ncbi:MAG: porin [Wigglesworthia glossinidia]|nr:porin [Wigglesworthia glossinidia]
MKKIKAFQLIIISIVYLLKNHFLLAKEIDFKKNTEISLYRKIVLNYKFLQEKKHDYNLFFSYGFLCNLKFSQNVSSFCKIEHTPFKNKYGDNLFFEKSISSNFGMNIYKNTIEYGKNRIALSEVSDFIKNIPSFDKYFNFKNVVLGYFPGKIVTYRNSDLYNIFPGLTFTLQRVFPWNSYFINIKNDIKNIYNHAYSAAIKYHLKTNNISLATSYLKNYATYMLVDNKKQYNSQFFSLGVKYEQSPIYLAILYGKKWHTNLDDNFNDIFLLHERILSNNKSIEFLSHYNLNDSIRPFIGYLISNTNTIGNNNLNKIQEKNIIFGTSMHLDDNSEMTIHYLVKNNRISNDEIKRFNELSLGVSYNF